MLLVNSGWTKVDQVSTWVVTHFLQHVFIIFLIIFCIFSNSFYTINFLLLNLALYLAYLHFTGSFLPNFFQKLCFGFDHLFGQSCSGFMLFKIKIDNFSLHTRLFKNTLHLQAGVNSKVKGLSWSQWPSTIHLIWSSALLRECHVCTAWWSWLTSKPPHNHHHQQQHLKGVENVQFEWFSRCKASSLQILTSKKRPMQMLGLCDF